MKQVLLNNPKEVKMIEIEKPKVDPGWLLIKTERCGICGTDAHSYMGETIFGKVFPFHIGHEVCGYIEEIGSEKSGFQKGDLIVINPFFTCNSCKACYTDHSNACENRTTIGLKGPGGYSEYILVPETSSYKVRKDVDLNRICFAEPLGNIVYALERLNIDNSMNVLISGAGAIGLMFLQLVIGRKPLSITVADFNEEKLKKAETLGATRCINPKDTVDTNQYEVIIDCTGSAKCVEQSVHKLAFGGQLMNFGVCPSDSELRLNPFELYQRDATIISSFALNKNSMQKAVNLLESDWFNTEILIDSVQPLSELEVSLIKMAEGTTSGKIIIDTTR